MRPGLAAGVVVAAVAFLATGIQADPKHKKPLKSASTTPWSEGVPEDEQKRALALFQEGNVFFEQARYTEAVSKYEVALRSWDHPNIRFNLAVCLIHMRQPMVAYDHLTRALRFGDAPLGKRLFDEANNYMALLETSLAVLEIETVEPDVKIEVDGREVPVVKGQRKLRLMVGSHQLVATRDGYQTDSRALNLQAGKTTTQRIDLEPIKERVKIEVRRENYERRWAWWVPWAVAGGGVAAGLAGTGVYVSARSQINRYDQALAADCPAGCTDDMIPASLSSEARAAHRKSEIAVGLWAGGGVLVVSGAILAVLNRPRLMEEHKVVPSLTASQGKVSLGLSFVFD